MLRSFVIIIFLGFVTSCASLIPKSNDESASSQILPPTQGKELCLQHAEFHWIRTGAALPLQIEGYFPCEAKKTEAAGTNGASVPGAGAGLSLTPSSNTATISEEWFKTLDKMIQSSGKNLDPLNPEGELFLFNSKGFVKNPTAGFRILVSTSLSLAEKTLGFYDPTILTVLKLYKEERERKKAAVEKKTKKSKRSKKKAQNSNDQSVVYESDFKEFIVSKASKKRRRAPRISAFEKKLMIAKGVVDYHKISVQPTYIMAKKKGVELSFETIDRALILDEIVKALEGAKVPAFRIQWGPMSVKVGELKTGDQWHFQNDDSSGGALTPGARMRAVFNKEEIFVNPRTLKEVRSPEIIEISGPSPLVCALLSQAFVTYPKEKILGLVKDHYNQYHFRIKWSDQPEFTNF